MVTALTRPPGRGTEAGVRENDIVAKANAMLYAMGSDHVEAINAISGECLARTGTTSPTASSGPATRLSTWSPTKDIGTCYDRTFNVGRATLVG